MPFARTVAERFGTDHHEFVVRPDALAILPSLVWHYNEPYADSSAIPTYYLARETRRHVTVALNGDGGDENFAGYRRYQGNTAAAWFDRVPAPVRRVAAMAGGRLPAVSPRSRLARARRWLEGAAEPPERRYARWVTQFHSGLKAELCTPEFARMAGRDSTDYLLHWYQRSDASDFTDATLDVDVNTYLPNDLLVKVDIASMAHGLEARSPLLDHKVMELAAALPSSYKLRGFDKKWILKRVAGGLLPAATIARPKMGFGVPIADWLRGPLRDLLQEALFGHAAVSRGYFQMAVVRRLVDQHMSGRRDWHGHLWTLLMLELWHQTFIDARTARPLAPVPASR